MYRPISLEYVGLFQCLRPNTAYYNAHRLVSANDKCILELTICRDANLNYYSKIIVKIIRNLMFSWTAKSLLKIYHKVHVEAKRFYFAWPCI